MNITQLFPLIFGLTKSVLLILFSTGLTLAFPESKRSSLRLWLLSFLILVLFSRLVFTIPVWWLVGLSLVAALLYWYFATPDEQIRVAVVLVIMVISAGTVALLRGQQVLFLVLFFSGYFSIEYLIKSTGFNFNKEGAGHGQ
jgi:hypothetical protein